MTGDPRDTHIVVVDQEGGYHAVLRAGREGRFLPGWSAGQASERKWYQEKTGRRARLMFFGRPFLRLALSSAENFRDAVMRSGMDFYVPRSYYDGETKSFR